MIYDFRLNIITRIVLLIALVLALVISFERQFFLTSGFVGIILTIVVVNMIHYVNQTNRDLANFFAQVKYNDFTSTGSARHKGEAFGELHDSFNMINRKFQNIRAEKEANHQFLYTIVEHVDVGLLSVDSNEEVILMNKALKAIIHKSYLINLDGLKSVDELLWNTVKTMKAGERELIKVNVKNKLVQLAVQSIDLTLNKESFRLIAFQDIQSELEEQELVAWQKLIRILTHEIMNSVAPIASLSSTIRDVIDQNGKVIEEEMTKQIRSSVDVIQKRSEGLLDFTETYRSLTRIPPPKFQLVDGKVLIEEAFTLLKSDLKSKNITVNLHFPPGPVTFQADPNLLEQVLINLIKNAMDAVREEEKPQIDIYLQMLPSHKITIQIIDNGSGIPEETMEHIFVPFYTTKREGSGIGLSLSRQIMRMHKGNIDLQSAEGQGTVVMLTL